MSQSSECLRGPMTGGVTHGDPGVIPSNRHVVGASGRDQSYGQNHQRQSQQSHGHPQSRLPPTQELD